MAIIPEGTIGHTVDGRSPFCTTLKARKEHIVCRYFQGNQIIPLGSWVVPKRISSIHSMDGRNPAPPKNPWGDASPVSPNKRWFAMVSKWCRISSIHSRLQGVLTVALAGLEAAAWCTSLRACGPSPSWRRGLWLTAVGC